MFTDETPFYATMGGQEGDTGVITGANGRFRVAETIRLRGGKVGHVGTVEEGTIGMGETLTLTVDAEQRTATCANHSATHLLQKALKNVLGAHVEQKGSLVTPDRLRFDFAHFQAMTAEQLAEVERQVNAQIRADLPVVTQEMTLAEAKKTGAMALFGEKYGETVRVVSMGDYSKELCGGTHVAHTGAIVQFKILSESGIAAGVRRIEALTGEGVLRYYGELEARLDRLAAALKVKTPELEGKVAHLLTELKALENENGALKAKLAQQSLGSVTERAGRGRRTARAGRAGGRSGCGRAARVRRQPERQGAGHRGARSAEEGKVSLLALASSAARERGAHAGQLVEAVAGLCGGNGGGKPDAAMAGAKDAAKVPEALAAVPELLKTMLK